MNYTDEELDKMPWDQLIALRKQVENNQQQQNRVANYEHQAYARETVQDNPLMAVPMAAMIPAYQVYKGVMGGARSEGGLQQMEAGYKGVLQGLLARLNK